MMTVVEQAHALQDAIRSGQVVEAERLARLLAKSKALVVVNVDDSRPIDRPVTTVRLKTRVESNLLCATVYLDVQPSMTFGDFRKLIHERFYLPPECQQFVMEDLDPKDEDSLEQHGLCYDDAALFVIQKASDEIINSIPLTVVDYPVPGPSSAPEIWTANATSVPTVTNLMQPQSPISLAGASGGRSPASPVDIRAEYQYAGSPEPLAEMQSVWRCPQCTFDNDCCMPVCEICGCRREELQQFHMADIRPEVAVAEVRPFNHQISDDTDCLTVEDMVDGGAAPEVPVDEWGLVGEQSADEVEAGYCELMAAEFAPLIQNNKPFECPICFSIIEPGEGVVIRECLHTFCRDCLSSHIGFSESAVVSCPFNDGNYKCQIALQDREIRALVSDDVYEQHLRLSAREAEGQAAQSYHCKSPDCPGWCTFEDQVTTFFCYACRRLNCLSCDAIHEGENCDQYQARLRAEMRRNPAAFANASLEQLMKFGDAMKCPSCQTVIIKADGCDWILCSVCKTEICWVTRQRRWGPRGHGDTSGGCQCRVNGQLCHPNCQNCH